MSENNFALNDMAIFRFFEEISHIPRGSGHSSRIADYLVAFAEERNLEYIRDGWNNVIIKRESSPQLAGSPCVILQAHTDMVIKKDEGCGADMEEKGVTLVYDGDIIRTDGTTLGADDGVGVAYMLALLDGEDLVLPKIETVFTADEEIGLIGAKGLDCSMLSGKKMINIDGGPEGVFIIGSAGGVRFDITLPATKEIASGTSYSLSVSGFRGGHSGVDINKGCGNAIYALAECLNQLPDIRICDISGGVADNAIPDSAVCVFASDFSLSEIEERLFSVISKYKQIENGSKFILEKSLVKSNSFTNDSSEMLASLILGLKNGVISMSQDIPDFVESSQNIGMISTGDDSFILTLSARSGVMEKLEDIKNDVIAKAESLGADVTLSGEYPAWEYNSNSSLTKTVADTYKKMHNRDAKVIAVHAGLECGLFSSKIKGLECVSIGPDAYGIHTSRESLGIRSFISVWDFILKLLANIK